MRLDFDEGTAAAVVQRLNVWKDELVAWFKTLASAAVYATLIVTFGFQVARVEGQSMAPTLADQDRLIVNKLAYRMGDPRRGSPMRYASLFTIRRSWSASVGAMLCPSTRATWKPNVTMSVA